MSTLTSTTIHWGNSLNYGLVGWWRTTPETFGRPVWADLLGKNHATLTNGASFRGASHLGGYGATAYDGTNDYAVLPTNPVGMPAIDGNKTIAFWCTSDGTTNRRILVSLVKDDTGTAANSIDLELNTAFGGQTMRAGKWGATELARASITMADNVWFYTVYTFAGGTAHKLYINGVDLTAGTGTGGDTGATGIVRFGSFNSAFPTPYHNRQLDDIRIYNRTLSTTEALGLYHESLAGYPTALVRRVRKMPYNAPAASGIVGPLVGGRLIGGPLIGGRLQP